MNESDNLKYVHSYIFATSIMLLPAILCVIIICYILRLTIFDWDERGTILFILPCLSGFCIIFFIGFYSSVKTILAKRRSNFEKAWKFSNLALTCLYCIVVLSLIAFTLALTSFFLPCV